jgi:hypothetical protein
MKMQQSVIVKTIIISAFIIGMVNFYSVGQTNNAFGDNQKVVDSVLVSGNTYEYVFAMYSGDINQDGAIDGTDFLEFDPSVQAGDGGYMPGDLNGDGAVDGSDFLVMDPNIQLGVGAARP